MYHLIRGPKGGNLMIFKKKLKTHQIKKFMPAEPIHMNEYTFIPIHEYYCESSTLDIQHIYGTIKPLGFIQIKNHEVNFLSIDNKMNINDLKQNIPELESIINSAQTTKEVL